MPLRLSLHLLGFQTGQLLMNGVFIQTNLFVFRVHPCMTNTRVGMLEMIAQSKCVQVAQIYPLPLAINTKSFCLITIHSDRLEVAPNMYAYSVCSLLPCIHYYAQLTPRVVSDTKRFNCACISFIIYRAAVEVSDRRRLMSDQHLRSSHP